MRGHNSETATVLAQHVLARDVGVLAELPVAVPLGTVDDLLEVAYLALELRHLRPADATLRICRWLRHHPATGQP